MTHPDSYGNNLRLCGSCSAWLLTVDGSTPTVYCPKCRDKQPAWDTWAAALTVGDTVYVQPYVAWRGLSRSEYLIVERDGEDLKVQVLGIPESLTAVHIADCAQQDVTPWRAEGAMY